MQISFQPVNDLYQHTEQSVMVSEYKHNTKITHTYHHPFYYHGAGFMKAGETNLVGVNFSIRHRHLTAHNITQSNEPERVYNLSVKNTHTYFLSRLGVWVHNGCQEMQPLARTPSNDSDSGFSPPDGYGKKPSFFRRFRDLLPRRKGDFPQKLAEQNLIDYAQLLQTSSNYSADSYQTTRLIAGSEVYGGVPGQTEFYTNKPLKFIESHW